MEAEADKLKCPNAASVSGTVAQVLALPPHSKGSIKHGFDSRMGRCWLWGAGPPQSAQCSGGLSPGPFWVEFACSPRVHKGFPPLRTPTEKTCKITEHMSIPDQRWTVHFTWS